MSSALLAEYNGASVIPLSLLWEGLIKRLIALNLYKIGIESKFDVLKPTAAILQEILVDFIQRKLPYRRVARLAGLLLLSGVDGAHAHWPEMVLHYLANKRQSDGAWVDCEDTVWCIYVLQCLGEEPEVLERSRKWLAAERSGDGWGYCQRDAPCIPITSIVRLLIPALCDDRSSTWLYEQWLRDFSGPVRLSYKAAWFLLSQGRQEKDLRLGEQTLKHLLVDQREDGGWGPWREHPAPTDCFSTGIAMWAIASSHSDNQTDEALERAIQWCESLRLDNGLFATHYIEEGSAWIHLGWSAALRRLNR